MIGPRKVDLGDVSTEIHCHLIREAYAWKEGQRVERKLERERKREERLRVQAIDDEIERTGVSLGSRHGWQRVGYGEFHLGECVASSRERLDGSSEPFRRLIAKIDVRDNNGRFDAAWEDLEDLEAELQAEQFGRWRRRLASHATK